MRGRGKHPIGPSNTRIGPSSARIRTGIEPCLSSTSWTKRSCGHAGQTRLRRGRHPPVGAVVAGPDVARVHGPGRERTALVGHRGAGGFRRGVGRAVRRRGDPALLPSGRSHPAAVADPAAGPAGFAAGAPGGRPPAAAARPALEADGVGAEVRTGGRPGPGHGGVALATCPTRRRARTAEPGWHRKPSGAPCAIRPWRTRTRRQVSPGQAPTGVIPASRTRGRPPGGPSLLKIPSGSRRLRPRARRTRMSGRPCSRRRRGSSRPGYVGLARPACRCSWGSVARPWLWSWSPSSF